MEYLKVIIADDDRPSRTLLFHFIQLLPEHKVVAEASNGEELIKLVMIEKPDIVLVDINMPGLNGVEAVKACKEIFPNLQVIFTTGYDEFAVEAFNISATDYIIKPIERNRLFMALEKAKTSLQLQQQSSANDFGNGTNKLQIKSNNSFIYLDIDELYFIEKEGRKTILHTCHERYETTQLLQELESRLPNFFYKTHRSFLVNLRNIVKIESSGETYLASFSGTEKKAHISKLKINEVQELIGGF